MLIKDSVTFLYPFNHMVCNPYQFVYRISAVPLAPLIHSALGETLNIFEKCPICSRERLNHCHLGISVTIPSQVEQSHRRSAMHNTLMMWNYTSYLTLTHNYTSSMQVADTVFFCCKCSKTKACLKAWIGWFWIKGDNAVSLHLSLMSYTIFSWEIESEKNVSSRNMRQWILTKF